MIVCTGEILADMIGKTENGMVCYERYAGGAPFNVACGLKKLGSACGFCGCVGDDLIGSFLENFARAQQFDYLRIARDKTRNTTLAFVELGDGGERKFSFFRKNTADSALPAVSDEIARIADVALIGSLPLTEESGRKFADELIQKMHEAKKTVAFDVNYRDDLFADRAAAIKIYARYIAAADIVKFSEDELDLFAEGANTEEKLYAVAGKDKIALVTKGAEGSMACVAGDAFFAGVLSAISDGEKNWNTILRKGNVCGALATERRGAIDSFPTKNRVWQVMRNGLR